MSPEDAQAIFEMGQNSRPPSARSCGAGIPPRDGEGTCSKCDPLGCIRNIVQQWRDAPAWPGPDPYEFMTRIAKVFE